MALRKFYNEYKAPFSKTGDVPRGFITLSKLKIECLKRLSVLNFLEKVSKEHYREWTFWVQAVMKEFQLKYPMYFTLCTENKESFKELRARHYNKVTYFVIAHVVVNRNSHELTAWFLRNEIRLFSLQFINLPIEKQREFMLENVLASEPLEKDAINLGITEVYKVPWTLVLPLVAKREVPIIKGKAYTDVSQLHVVAESHRRLLLKSFLSSIRISLPTATLDPRFKDLIEDLGIRCDRLLGHSVSFGVIKDEDKAKLGNLPDLSYSFPPCMLRVYQHMECRNHLRYHGRLQYVSFLKDIGLTVDDTLIYFQNIFLQGMSEKEYARGRYEYLIKYQFGLVGKKKSQDCSDCEKIQMMSKESDANDCHGCPLTTVTNLNRLFSTPAYEDINKKDKANIMSLCNRPGKACAAIFSTRNRAINAELPDVIINPLQYFILSRNQIVEDNDSSCDDLESIAASIKSLSQN